MASHGRVKEGTVARAGREGLAAPSRPSHLRPSAVRPPYVVVVKYTLARPRPIRSGVSPVRVSGPLY